MRDISNLETDLNKALDDYRENINFVIETSSINTDVKHDIEEVAKNVFYTLSEFRDCIIKYLRNI